MTNHPKFTESHDSAARSVGYEGAREGRKGKTMKKKVVINECFGGFGLSALAVKRLADLSGRECYFFETAHEDGRLVLGRYVPLTLEGAEEAFMFHAFDIPNPNDVLIATKDWHEMSMEQRKASNELHSQHSLNSGRDIDREDPKLVQVVEELGEKANGKHARLKVIEIPKDVEYQIDEYDGNESIHEIHRSWS